YTIRRTIPESHRFLHVTRGAVQWRRDSPCSVDVWEFETSVNQAHHGDSPAERQHYLEQAIDNYHGDFLAGQFDDWILAFRERLRRRYLDALEEQLSLAENSRQYKEAIRLARRLLREDPLHEAAYRRLMRLQSLDGDVAGALRTYHACSAHLRHELGVDPAPATREAYRRLVQVDVPQQSTTPARLPLTGRNKAWQSLMSAWRQGSGGQGKFVMITGEAGIGKTRLAEELLDWAARQGISALSASCYAAGGSLPYAPITTWLRTMTCRPCLENLPDNWLQEVSRLLPELLIERPDLQPPGPISESWQRQHLFAALGHALLSQPQPFVLFIDDLQWCDADTLQWLSYLMHFDQTARFLLLGAARSEEVGVDHPLNDLIDELRHDDTVVEMELSRLNESETQVLAGHVLGGMLDDAQSAELAAHSEGVPLFIVEMARAGWADIAGAGRERSRDDHEQHHLLPAKVRAVIEARLSHLSPPATDLAALGAAIGRYFTYDLLAAASTQNEAVIVRALDELWQQRILREQGA
ncbi:MAG: ATP-binding protein, partial [Candidatus Promineifilaceae bacterium]